MADEDKTQETQPEKPAPAAFDAEALKNVIQNSIRDSLAAVKPEPRPEPEPEPRQPVSEPDAMTKLVAPIVAPAISQVHTIASSAMDAARFYGSGSAEDKALREKFSIEVEAKFDELLRAGRPAPRADILNWLIGGPKRQEYFEYETKRREEAVQRAANAETVGAGSFRAPALAKPLQDMSDEELAQFVEKAGGA